MQDKSDLREVWLNKPLSSDITTKALRKLMGQYIVEAMQLIEKDNLGRQLILKSSDTSSKEKKKALNAGVWYPGDYCTFIKDTNFIPRFKWLQKNGSFFHGFMDSNLWTQEKDQRCATGKTPIFHWKKGLDNSPAETLVDILEGKSFCLLECATVMNIAHYAALLRIWGKARFDRCFSGKAPLSLAWSISHYATINPMYLFLEGVRDENRSVIRIGDKIGIKTHPGYPFKHPFGAATGWNLICCNEGDEPKFVGFGMSVDGLTENEISQELIMDYNLDTCPVDDRAIGDMLATAQKHQENHLRVFGERRYPIELTEKEFQQNGGGLTSEIIRLNVGKVKMILSQPEDQANLFEAFKLTKEGARKYAMDAKTCEMWKSHKARVTFLPNDSDKKQDGFHAFNNL